MRELAIRINIADREYTLRVNAEEENLVRRAADLLNQQIKEKKAQLKVKDRQDLLSMVAFDCIFEALLYEQKKAEAGAKIEALDRLISGFL